MSKAFSTDYQLDMIEKFRKENYNSDKESRFYKNNFAKILGYERVTSYNNLLRGKGNLTLKAFIKFCKEFNQDPNDYLFENPHTVKKQTPQKTIN